MLALSLLLLATQALGGHVIQRQKTCTVHPSGNFTDDSPAIVEAFSLCGQGGRIEFLNETYWIEKVMNTTGLNDAVIDLRGTLLWSAANISYWLNNSLPIGFQNQSSAWFLGGNNILFDGHGYGTFNGNGQIWTMTISASSYVDMLDIFVSSTSNDSQSTINTDGADTLDSHHITFRRWEVHNGDDSIAMKRNSSDILIEDSIFYIGTGVAIGSTGQFPGEYEAIERVLTRNCSFIGTRFVGYIKTWTGVQQGFPPNGGGGGIGVWTNSTFTNITTQVAEITQCTSFSGAVGQCDTSTMQISNITWSGLQGSLLTSTVASLQCSGAAPCQDLRILDTNVTFTTNTTVGTFSCHAVASTEGFTCQ
ncbi:pectin lyase fold/virulence factor [Mycena albidolilacea]|uniref:Pectin lyase fold/virulence factor n=1 Tax=Mycena albidolilacea TaxID=1033008 RepID=A0AAD6ZR30_9AGAR|nr:pectin lyase fold/virulence factor [Mycena albidolilacea]